MNKTHAKIIAEIITFDQLQEMFNNAKENITNWTEISAVNRSMTKGTVWNILYHGVKPEVMHQSIALRNMIWEFGDHLPDELFIKNKKPKQKPIKVLHQEPIF